MISIKISFQRKQCNKGMKIECENEYVKSCSDTKRGYKGFTRKCEGVPLRKCHEVPTEDCSTVDDTVCEFVPNKECHEVNKIECKEVQREVGSPCNCVT